MRMLEDHSCPSYKHCFNKAAHDPINDKYVPCYECMGGKLMDQTFHCSNCKTVWKPDNNDWTLSKLIQCPFCNKRYLVAVFIKEGKLAGEILHATATTK